MTLATKSHDRTSDGIQKDIEKSLKELQTEYIDLYQCHFVSDENDYERIISPDGALKGLLKAKEEGLIGHIGLTAHNLDLLERVIEDGFFETVMTCFSLLEPAAKERVIPKAIEKNIGVIAMKPFSGGVLGWLFLMPFMLFIYGDNLGDVVAQVTALNPEWTWTDMAASAYNALIKPIAVGAMLVGAFFTLFRMRKSLITGIGRSITDVKKARGGGDVETIRTDKDLPFSTIVISILALIIPMVVLYQIFTHNIGSALVSAVVMVIMGLLFAAVAGYLVGIIGSSSNPISGLTLTTLLIAALMMVLMGQRGNEGIAAVLGVAAVVCCVAGVAGDMIQDWKVGHILGGTPWRMQIGGMIGVVAAALTLTFSFWRVWSRSFSRVSLR